MAKVKKIRGQDVLIDDNYLAVVLILEQILNELRRIASGVNE